MSNTQASDTTKKAIADAIRDTILSGSVTPSARCRDFVAHLSGRLQHADPELSDKVFDLALVEKQVSAPGSVQVLSIFPADLPHQTGGAVLHFYARRMDAEMSPDYLARSNEFYGRTLASLGGMAGAW